MTVSELQNCVDQIYEHFNDPKINVRKMAVELLAGLSVDQDDALVILSQNPSHYVSKLFSKLSDQPEVAAIAWDAITNFAVSPAIALHLFDRHLERIMTCIQSKELVFTEAATKLLANMTKHVEARPAMADLLPQLLPLYLAGPKHNRNCDYEFLASVLADLTNLKQGRIFFVSELSRIEYILQDLNSPSLIRRGGVASIIKNCLFETDFHHAILEKEIEDDFMLTTLVGRLLDARSKLDDQELEKLPVELQLLEKHEAESDVVIRSIIIECLIIFASTKQARDVIRSKCVYPILREWHKLEPVDEMKELVEKMVELIIRDEE